MSPKGRGWKSRAFFHAFHDAILDAAFDELLCVANVYEIRATVNPMELAWTAQNPVLGCVFTHLPQACKLHPLVLIGGAAVFGIAFRL